MGIFVPAAAPAGSTANAAVKTLWGPGASAQLGATSASVTTLALNDADNSAASIFVAPKDGTTDRIGINVSAIGGTPPAYNLGLVTLDASGNPTTTAYGGSAAQSVSSFSTGWQWITLTTPATAAAGDRIAARIWPGGTAPDATNNITLRSRYGLHGNASLPHAQEFATAWTKTVSSPMIAVRYSDGTVAPIWAISASAILTSNFSSSASPDEQGALLTLPFSARCVGARLWLDPNSASCTGTAKLYDVSDTLLASAAFTAAEFQSNSLGFIDVHWDAVSLTKDASYRLTHLATSTDTRQVPNLGTPDTDSKNGVPEGSRWQQTTRNAGGAWTNTANTVPILALWLDQVTVPA